MKSTTDKLIVKDLEVGTGKQVESGDTVVMHYTGWLEEPGEQDHKGEQFDSSHDSGIPFETKIGAGRVIQGWDEGVPGTQIGGKRRLIIPSDLGYGAEGAGLTIPPFATLIFDVELLEIK